MCILISSCILFTCTHAGRCDFENPNCPVFQILRLCKSQGRACCKSCPLQFVDDRPNLITRDDLVVSLDQDVYVVPRGTHASFCCVASSSTPNAFLPFLFNCNFCELCMTRYTLHTHVTCSPCSIHVHVHQGVIQRGGGSPLAQSPPPHSHHLECLSIMHGQK